MLDLSSIGRTTAHIFSCTAVLTLFCYPLEAAAANANQRDVQTIIQSQYAKLETAFITGDAKAYSSVCTPDAVFVQTNLGAQSITNLVRTFSSKSIKGVTLVSCKDSIHKLAISSSGERAEADVEQETRASVVDKAGLRGPKGGALTYILTSYSHDFWVLMCGKWFLAKSIQAADTKMQVGGFVTYVRNRGEPGFGAPGKERVPTFRAEVPK